MLTPTGSGVTASLVIETVWLVRDRTMPAGGSKVTVNVSTGSPKASSTRLATGTLRVAWSAVPFGMMKLPLTGV